MIVPCVLLQALDISLCWSAGLHTMTLFRPAAEPEPFSAVAMYLIHFKPVERMLVCFTATHTLLRVLNLAQQHGEN